MLKKLLFAAVLLIPSVSFAQGNKLLVAASSSSGTYSKMLSEIAEVCSTEDLQIAEVKDVHGGAPGNLAALVNNEVSAAFVHSDVVEYHAKSDAKYRQLQTLVALYPEEVHIVARRAAMKVGGIAGFGSKEVTFNTLGDLKGWKVGGAGGGAITAKVLQGSGEAGFTVVEKQKGEELLPALDSGEVQAVVFVGGAPLDLVKKLDGSKYKLIGVPEEIYNKVSSYYKRATISYPGLASGAVKTIAPSAIILTRLYKSPKMREPQIKFRTCFQASLDDLKETPGKHPKWQQVEADDQGTWTWLDLPKVAVAPAESSPSKKAARK